jgi:hypothetical protein
MLELNDLVRDIGEKFIILADALDKQQEATLLEICAVKNEVYKNKNLLKNIANMINEEL